MEAVTVNNVKTYGGEDHENALRQRLAELRGAKRTKSLDSDEVEAKRLRAGAEAYMVTNPSVATEWLQKADILDAKKNERIKLKADQNIALDNYKQAVEAWRKNPEGSDEYNAMIATIADGKTVGLTLTNPITNYTQEKQFASTLEEKIAGREQTAQQYADTLDQRKKEFSSDAWFKEQNLLLAQQKKDQAARKSMQLTGDEAAKLGQMEDAEPIIQALESKVADDMFMNAAVDQINTNDNSMVGNLFSRGINSLSSPETQKYANAKRAISQMLARDLSGAAIGKEEWQAFQANLPNYGDKPDVLKQKRAFRLSWIQDKKTRGTNRTVTGQETVVPTGTPTPTIAQKILFKKQYGMDMVSNDDGKTWSIKK